MRRVEERLQDENLQRVHEPRRSLDAGQKAERLSQLLWSQLFFFFRNANEMIAKKSAKLSSVILPRMSLSLATSTRLTSGFLSSWIHPVMENCVTFRTMSYW